MGGFDPTRDPDFEFDNTNPMGSMSDRELGMFVVLMIICALAYPFYTLMERLRRLLARGRS